MTSNTPANSPQQQPSTTSTSTRETIKRAAATPTELCFHCCTADQMVSLLAPYALQLNTARIEAVFDALANQNFGDIPALVAVKHSDRARSAITVKSAYSGSAGREFFPEDSITFELLDDITIIIEPAAAPQDLADGTLHYKVKFLWAASDDRTHVTRENIWQDVLTILRSASIRDVRAYFDADASSLPLAPGVELSYITPRAAASSAAIEALTRPASPSPFLPSSIAFDSCSGRLIVSALADFGIELRDPNLPSILDAMSRTAQVPESYDLRDKFYNVRSAELVTAEYVSLNFQPPQNNTYAALSIKPGWRFTLAGILSTNGPSDLRIQQRPTNPSQLIPEVVPASSVTLRIADMISNRGCDWLANSLSHVTGQSITTSQFISNSHRCWNVASGGKISVLYGQP